MYRGKVRYRMFTPRLNTPAKTKYLSHFLKKRFIAFLEG
jgi:hypothetical protein